MQTVDADAAAKTRTGNVIFWTFVGGYLALVGLFMVYTPN